MKKIWVMVILILTALIVTPIISADVFPKPKTLVIVKGIDKPYAFDLFKKGSSAPILDEEALNNQVNQQYYQNDCLCGIL